eukprot:CAMPEP_0183728914 /NCGR_PEP_ID=MMETSP0737-20130205/29250_1 /TAXON_ID=385413 /ORGANISM="Thalassiosira miniscula, Strain CCMP1093" /LENGTH=46 /DNA_ID= /DNA_START= /DNA_END= /DNA_ORIENTATION=
MAGAFGAFGGAEDDDDVDEEVVGVVAEVFFLWVASFFFSLGFFSML